MVKVGVLVGSLRKESYSQKLANNMLTLFPEDLEVVEIKIDDLAFYNEDIDVEGNRPAEYDRFRQQVKECQAFLFVTPEYNRGLPAALKNALDVGSRPYGENAFDGKPALVASQSPGAISGFGANHQLRQALVFLNVPVMQQPELYITGTAKMFDESGKIKDESTVDFLQTAVNSFVTFADRFIVK